MRRQEVGEGGSLGAGVLRRHRVALCSAMLPYAGVDVSVRSFLYKSLCVCGHVTALH